MTEFPIRPGCLLAWGPGLAVPDFSPDTQALFAFVITGEPSRDADHMTLHVPAACQPSECACTTLAFSATVVLSGPTLDELLRDDDSTGAAVIRNYLGDASSVPLTLPLTPGARLAVESIRRCPFAGVCRAMALSARVNDLLIEFLTCLAAIAPPAPPLRRLDEQINAAAGLLAQRLEDPPTLAVLAGQVGVSETTLKRGFHQVFGTTVFGYLREQRMTRAHALLRSGEVTVLEAATRVGYSNPSNFTAAFRRHFGINPKEFQLAARR